MGLVSALIFLLVPWQVAFLGCWIFQLLTCATARSSSHPARNDNTSLYPMTPTTPELLHGTTTTDDADFDFDARTPSAESERFLHAPPSPPSRQAENAYVARNNANEHLLLLMTWLLPLAAPVLAVWVRTLMTAGYTTPFDGDHNVLYVLPFLMLIEVGSGMGGFMITR